MSEDKTVKMPDWWPPREGDVFIEEWDVDEFGQAITHAAGFRPADGYDLSIARVRYEVAGGEARLTSLTPVRSGRADVLTLAGAIKLVEFDRGLDPDTHRLILEHRTATVGA